jgi:putative spermidine/putrescine transport system permease protein
MLLLMSPSVLFVAVFFILPVLFFMYKSVDNTPIVSKLPATMEIVQDWEGSDLPNENVYAAIVRDLQSLELSQAAVLGRNLNYKLPGYRSLITKTTRKLPKIIPAGNTKNTLIKIDQRWADIRYMVVLRQQSGILTDFNLLTAIELQRDVKGSISFTSDENAIFHDLYWRTLYISIGVTLICLLIGYPVAYVMASSSPATANKLLMLVLVPFWTSLLVRTTAWVILLQTEGLVNDALIWTGITSEPIQLVYNMTGIFIAMVHVLLPYMILPLYSVMKNVQPAHLKAAASLGARPLQVFSKVYLPLTMPGVLAGSTLVFVLSVGFYVTPALVGGPGDQMIGYFIAYFTNSSANWGLAAALGTYLIVMVAVIYLIFGRLIGFNKLTVR